jgi:uncharacterized protein YukE
MSAETRRDEQEQERSPGASAAGLQAEMEQLKRRAAAFERALEDLRRELRGLERRVDDIAESLEGIDQWEQR